MEQFVADIFAKVAPGRQAPSIVLRGRPGGTARQGHPMRIGVKSHKMQLRDVLIHETAHYFDYYLRGRSDHSEMFYRSLKACIKAAGVELRDYGWHAEYLSLYDRARHDGLVTQPHYRREAKAG